MSRFFAVGALILAAGVGFGAFGAHGLRAVLSEELRVTWETAARYQMYHGLGLLAVGYAVDRGLGRGAAVAGWLFVVGILLFSGGLYVYALGGVKTLALIAPVGGLCFMGGWVSLAIAALRKR